MIAFHSWFNDLHCRIARLRHKDLVQYSGSARWLTDDLAQGTPCRDIVVSKTIEVACQDHQGSRKLIPDGGDISYNEVP